MDVLKFSNYLGILDFLQEFISSRVAGLIFDQAVCSENLRAWSSGCTGRIIRVRSCSRRGITEHEKEEQINLQPSLVLDWKLSRSQNIDQPTELKGVLLYKRRWKPLPFRITRILGMMRLFFYNIGICTFHHFTPWQMVSLCTSWGLCSSLRSGKDIFTRSPKARSLQIVQRHISEPHSHILSLRYERQPILSWSRGQCSAADNQFTADGCWFGKTSSELCKCWKGR